MSQEKVDKYKSQKSNRKKIMRREKLFSLIRRAALVVVVLALLGWLGYSGYTKYEASIPRLVTDVNFSAVDNFMTSLSSDSTDEGGEGADAETTTETTPEVTTETTPETTTETTPAQ